MLRPCLWLMPLALAACVPAEPPGPVAGVPVEESGEVAPVLPTGYAAAPAATQLSDPRAVAFDAAGMPLVVEGAAARLSRVEPDGSLVPVAQGGGNGPWTGVAVTGGRVYVAEAGGPMGGRILAVDDKGGVTPLVGDLPGGGVVGPLAAGPDGALYVGVASAGEGARDIPCQDVRMRAGGRVEGEVPCTGSVLRIDPANGEVAAFAWGFRHPVGLAFGPEGKLLLADDLPGGEVAQLEPAPKPSAPDLLWAVVPGVWYGWPDYAGQLASADPELAVHPNPPPEPAAQLEGSLLALDVGHSPGFGGVGQAFVAMRGADGQGMVGFSDPETGGWTPFVANLREPSALAFAPDGQSLFVADAATGRLWRIVALPMAGSSGEG